MPTERDFESYVDRQIKEAAARGEFDDLPGAGKPIDVGDGYDPEWWTKRFILRERARGDADRLRREIRDRLPRLKAMKDRAAAEAGIAELRAAIAAVNDHLSAADRIPPLDL